MFSLVNPEEKKRSFPFVDVQAAFTSFVLTLYRQTKPCFPRLSRSSMQLLAAASAATENASGRRCVRRYQAERFRGKARSLTRINIHRFKCPPMCFEAYVRQREGGTGLCGGHSHYSRAVYDTRQ